METTVASAEGRPEVTQASSFSIAVADAEETLVDTSANAGLVQPDAVRALRRCALVPTFRIPPTKAAEQENVRSMMRDGDCALAPGSGDPAAIAAGTTTSAATRLDRVPLIDREE